MFASTTALDDSRTDSAQLHGHYRAPQTGQQHHPFLSTYRDIILGTMDRIIRRVSHLSAWTTPSSISHLAYPAQTLKRNAAGCSRHVYICSTPSHRSASLYLSLRPCTSSLPYPSSPTFCPSGVAYLPPFSQETQKRHHRLRPPQASKTCSIA